MELSADLLKRFVQATNDKEPKKKETTVYGTVVKNGESTYVKLDGSSNTLTPAFLGVCADNNDRVIVNIKNHSATITNNLTSPPKTGIYSEILNENFNIITGRIASIEMITSKAITTDTLSAALVDAGYISAEEIHSEYIRADELVSKIATIDSLTANDAFIKNIQTVVIDADYIKSAVANVGYLTADSAVITSLQTDKLNTSELNAKVADLGYLTADSAVIKGKLTASELNSEVAKLGYLTADSATITGKLNANELNAKVAELGYLTANNAVITNLQTDKLDANQLSAEVAKLGYLDAKMANIDFANLNKANIGQLFANVGLISSATITDGHVTGYLDSVEVNANKITAGTLAVDRLLIKDYSGNYKMATYDSSGNIVTTTVNGSVITNRTITADHLVAGTITANEINMTNLVGNSAFINAINTNSIVVSASNNASNALSTANSANTKAQGIIDNIYTPNTTTINGGKIYTGSIKAAQIDVNDLFAQKITATGTITGAILRSNNTTFGRVELSNGRIMSLPYSLPSTGNVSYIAQGRIISRHYTSLPSWDGSFNSYDWDKEIDIHGDIIYIAEKSRIDGNDGKRTIISPSGLVVELKENGITSSLNTTSIYPGKIYTGIVYENETPLSDKYAPKSHSHDYLPLSGGTVNGAITFGKSDDYGIRTNTNNYGRIGDSTNQFYEVYSHLIYEDKTLLSNKYLGINANAVSATKATQDGNGNVISSTYIPNFGSNPTYGNGSALTQPDGEAVLSIRTTTGVSDVGIFYLSQDNCYIANSSDNAYTFGVFDTDLTKNMADVDAASFVVLSNGTGAKIRGNEVVHAGNIGSQSVNYATSSGNADTVDGKHFHWDGRAGQPTWLFGGDDGVNMYVYNPSNFSVNYANHSGTMQGSYTYNGGQQNPNYFGVNKVGALMMNTPINGDSHYKDFLIMDCYAGSDVGGATAIGVDRQEMRAFIMGSDAVRTSWTRSAELITTSNIASQSVNYANSAGSAPASDVYSWAKQSTKPSYALNEITGSSDIFKVVTYSYNSVSVASGSSKTVTPSRTNIPSGYTAVAVYTVNSGGGRIYPRAHSADGTIVLVNESSNATVTPSMKVLCVKSTCVG